MRVGFLHLGDSAHGVSRYGRILAAETRRQSALPSRSPGVEVFEIETDFGSAAGDGVDAAIVAARGFAGCDVVHVQFNRALFGEGRAQLENIRAFFSECRAPIVANLHDVYLDNPWAEWRRRSATLVTRLQRLRQYIGSTLPTRAAIRFLMRNATRTIVCFECERERLAELHGVERTRVVPHFIENRPSLPDRAAARRDLGFTSERVVSLLGYIHRRKGHDLLVEALQSLPPDVKVAFIGAATNEHRGYLSEMLRSAEKHGVRDRLIVTGWVDEGTLDRWLVATDLAVCPFRFFSASGSLATWISALRPVLCHALPQIEEYRSRAPDSISTFDRFAPDALASAVTAALDASARGGIPTGLARLREEFSVANVTRLNQGVYLEVLGGKQESSR